MYLKKYRKIVIGVVIGVLCTLPAGVLAGWVSALKDGDVVFKFGDQVRTLPSGYTALFYEDRIYVPIRFVAEQLEAEVDWDQLSKIVSVKPKPCEKCQILQEKKEILEKENKELRLKLGETETHTKGQPSGSYQKLPLKKTLPDMNIAVTGLIKDDHYIRVYVRLENKITVPLQLLQSQTAAIVDGEKFKTSDIGYFALDERWYHDVAHEEIKEGYIILPPIPEDSKEMFLELTLLYNDMKQETTTVEFCIKLDS